MKTAILAIACGLLASSTAFAGEADDLAPFLDETVFAVARIDLEQLEPADVAAYLEPQSTAELISSVKQTLQDLGVSRVYAVYSFNDVGRQMPYLIVPTSDADRARHVAAYLYSGDANGATSLDVGEQRPPRVFEVAEPVGTTVFCGARAARRRLDELPRPDRPGLAAALHAVEGSPLAFTVTPTADQRRVVSEMFPTLPAEFGGLNGAEVAAGVEWAAATVNPGTGSATLIVEAADADAANRLSESIPPLLGSFLPGQATSTGVDGRRLTLTVESMPDSGVVATLVGSLFEAGIPFDATQSLKELALAMHNFHDVWSSFPPPASYDESGRPLLSWRVYLLPYLDASDLYEQFHFDEPWDSPHNRELIPQMPDVFKSNDIALNLAGKTRFLLPVADETPWHGKVGTMIREITDGTSNTIMIAQADRDHAVAWTEPADLNIDWDHVHEGLTGDDGQFRAALCDGAAVQLPVDIPDEVLTRLFQESDGEPVDWDAVQPAN